MRTKIRMQSSESAHFNTRLHPEKMKLNMFDPTVRKHVVYNEKKIKK